MELTAKNLKKSIRNDIDDLEGTWAHLNAAIDERIKEIEADKKAHEEELETNPLAKLMESAKPKDAPPKEEEKFADGFIRSKRNT